MLTLQLPENAGITARVQSSVPAENWQLVTPSPILRVAGLAPVRPTRREFLIGAGSLLVLAPYGCGSGGEGDEGASGGTRTIEHKYGSTEVPSVPERVVTVGLSDHDYVLALGFEPVGVTDWYADYPYATWPWAQDELGYVTPEVMPRNNDEFDFEKIAALEPDLIIGMYSGMTEQEYETLSAIAPTVAPSGEYPDYGIPWQETTRMAGRVLGREERAEELISG